MVRIVRWIGSESYLLDTCRLILHGAQRTSVHGCGQHSYPVPFHSSRCLPPLLSEIFVAIFLTLSQSQLFRWQVYCFRCQQLSEKRSFSWSQACMLEDSDWGVRSTASGSSCHCHWFKPSPTSSPASQFILLQENGGLGEILTFSAYDENGHFVSFKVYHSALAVFFYLYLTRVRCFALKLGTIATVRSYPGLLPVLEY